MRLPFRSRHPRALVRATPQFLRCVMTGAVAASLVCTPVLAQQTGATSLPGNTRSTASQLPGMGDASELTASAERRLGDRIAREIFRDPDYIDDPVLAEYVDAIWQPLLTAARSRGEMSDELQQRFAWQIMMGRDRSVNAFALPGGYLGLHLGLIAVVSSRDELASVLAHELSHVTQRHISRLTTKQNAQTPWIIGAMILGALAASKNTNAASALITGGQAVAMQNQLNFSRDMEREADRVGFGVMSDAGFEPQGFASMFDKLQDASRLNDNGAFPYLRSHPLTSERIADIRGRLPLGVTGHAVPPMKLDHAMISARARVLSNHTAIDALRATVEQAKAPRLAEQPVAVQAGVLYAAALASAQMREFGSIAPWTNRLAALVKGDPSAQRLATLLDIELALLAGQPAPELVPSGRAELMLMSQVWMRQGRAAQASAALQSWVAAHPLDASAWQMLGRANMAQGQVLRGIRAEAEAQVALLDYAAAMDRFKAAQGLVRDAAAGVAVNHIEASIIDTRARQVQSLLREQALER
jgi:predicted Zn-dependent protease